MSLVQSHVTCLFRNKMLDILAHLFSNNIKTPVCLYRRKQGLIEQVKDKLSGLSVDHQRSETAHINNVVEE